MPDDAESERAAPLPTRQDRGPAVAAPAADHGAGACRLFLAIWPSPAAHAQLLDHQRRWSWPPGAAPVAAERLHLTLHFIGSLPRRRMDEVGAGLQVAIEPFELVLDRAEIWPHGLVVLRATSPTAALQRLHGRLGEALQALGLNPERRRFRPHVTLARRATGSIPPLASVALRWQVSSYTLVESLAGAATGYLVRRRYD
ncbi:MAG TPA: RNA 2',3'-cyclic phosphodiesterase [Accumulibacter sp.]|uniref:RNA 2',3'-cyclic phosphodiesterase n=1 Tax=Accumulibacter sp. TaxID=2053492 RepID=UPI002CABB17A|nr:RNA 2',3'-cyclic phosphodiesterase [Accumulibacter sp.]HRD90784.1 RNA 2',3'-cyclic phosphodiesterase [Accumulibacter sp.]